jgi:hypothetical protein
MNKCTFFKPNEYLQIILKWFPEISKTTLELPLPNKSAVENV